MHDNICKTNHYNCFLLIFVVSDNNLKTRIVAQAVVDNKTQFSYELVFKCIKKATSVLPRVFIIDDDSAINSVIITQFSDSFYIHCI